MDRISVRVICPRGASNEYTKDIPKGLPNDVAIFYGFGMLFVFGWSVDENIQITVYRNGVEIPPLDGWKED